MLRDQVNDSGLGHGRKTSLRAKLDAAQRALTKEHAGAATHKLMAFIQEVRAFKRTHRIQADLADMWVLEAKNNLVEIRRGN